MEERSLLVYSVFSFFFSLVRVLAPQQLQGVTYVFVNNAFVVKVSKSWAPYDFAIVSLFSLGRSSGSADA